MSNFFTDTQDLEFCFDNLQLNEVIELMELSDPAHQDFDDQPEVISWYKESLIVLGRICGEQIAPLSQSIDEEGALLLDGKVQYPKGSQIARQLLSDAGYMGAILPREFGGSHLPATIYMLMIEMVSRADAALMTMFGYQDVGELIARFGSAEQQQKYLPKLASGEHIGAIVLTEPGAGSDLQSIKVKASQNETGEWLLSGTKQFISNGCGDVLMVLARSEAGVDNLFGLSLFVCPGDQVRVNRIEEKMGLHGSPTCELLFDNAKAELIGKRKFGLTKYILESLSQARFSVAAQAIGIAEGAYQMALEYAGQRRQFNQNIIDLMPVRNLLAEMKLSLESGRALVLFGAQILDLKVQLETWIEKNKLTADPALVKERQRSLREAQLRLNLLSPMVKYWATEEALRVTLDAQQVFGGMGYIKETGIEQKVRDIRITTIYEGTSQVQVAASIKMVLANVLAKDFERLESSIAKKSSATNSLLLQLQNLREHLLVLCKTAQQTLSSAELSASAEAIVNAYCRLLAGYLLTEQSLSGASEHFTRHKQILAQRQLNHLKAKLAELSVLIETQLTGDLEDKSIWFM